MSIDTIRHWIDRLDISTVENPHADTLIAHFVKDSGKFTDAEVARIVRHIGDMFCTTLPLASATKTVTGIAPEIDWKTRALLAEESNVKAQEQIAALEQKTCEKPSTIIDRKMCQNCRFCDVFGEVGAKDSDYECHRYPPTFVDTDLDGIPTATPVYHDSWCGEWAARDEAPQ